MTAERVERTRAVERVAHFLARPSGPRFLMSLFVLAMPFAGFFTSAGIDGVNPSVAAQALESPSTASAIPIVDNSSSRSVGKPWTAWFPDWFPGYMGDKLGWSIFANDEAMQTVANFGPRNSASCVGTAAGGVARRGQCATLCVSQIPVDSRIVTKQGFAYELSARRPSGKWLPCDGKSCLGTSVARAQASFDSSGPVATTRTNDVQVCWTFRQWAPERRLNAILFVSFRPSR